MLSRLTVRNFRSLASVENFSLGPLSVFFGPNGVGKSSLLESLGLVRDCMRSGVPQALSWRGLGRGYTRSDPSAKSLSVIAATSKREYALELFKGFGVLSEVPRELLADTSKPGHVILMDRPKGHREYNWTDPHDPQQTIRLSGEGGNLALNSYALLNPSDTATAELHSLLRGLMLYRSHTIPLHDIKTNATDIAGGGGLHQRGENLWSLLRELNDRRDIDDRYSSIIRLMQRAFPDFLAFSFLTQGSSQVYCEWKFRSVREPILAAHVADGMVQFALLLAALFGNPPGCQVIMFDEPDLSLHPWALFVLAEAIEEATSKWERQVLLATHSPVLLSQFPEESLYLMMPKDGATTIQRVSEIEESKDLLAQYAAGALYMSQLIGEQSPEPMAHVTEMSEP